MTVRIPEPPIPSHWLLDANVIFSEWSRVFCLELATRHQAKLYTTPLIEEEAFRNLVRLGRVAQIDADAQRANLSRVLDGMRLDVDASAYVPDVKFVDNKDQPIAATALWMHHHYQADIGLITWNVKDFPRKQLLKKRVVRYTPDELAVAICKQQLLAPQVLLDSAMRRLVAHFESYPLIQPTAYVEKSRPLPNSDGSWQDFLKRNRLNLLARHLARAMGLTKL